MFTSPLKRQRLGARIIGVGAYYIYILLSMMESNYSSPRKDILTAWFQSPNVLGPPAEFTSCSRQYAGYSSLQ